MPPSAPTVRELRPRPSTAAGAGGVGRLVALVGLLVALALPGCRPNETKPPYARGNAPMVPELMKAAGPRLTALQVPSAKVRFNRSIAGNLMFVAQAPGRFTGQIQVAGKELVSVAFHEQNYTFRSVSGRGPPVGFYKGVSASCAIEQLLGLPLEAEDFVKVVLGGIPDFPETGTDFVEVLSQSWDGDKAHEVLVLRKGGYEREVRFTWQFNTWWPVSVTQWRVGRGGQRSVMMWSLSHEDLHQVGTSVLPGRTKITRPGIRGDQRVVINYRKQVPNPDLPAPGEPKDNGDDGGWDEAWDGEEGGWEGEDGPEEGGAQTTPKPEPAPVVKPPALFELTGDDLPNRGDLCPRSMAGGPDRDPGSTLAG